VEPSSGQHVSVDASASALFMRRDPLRYSDNSVKMYVVQNAAPQGGRGDSTYTPMKLLGGSLAFTVDVSEVGCSCIAALYLVSMPALKPNGERALEPESYCDAVGWNGFPCPELDIFEANRFAATSTIHACQPLDTAPKRWRDNLVNNERYDGEGSYYGGCDNWGCAHKSADLPANSFGPGRQYRIDTNAPFRVTMRFPTDADGNLPRSRSSTRKARRR